MIRSLALATVLALGSGAALAADMQYGIDVSPAELAYMMGQHTIGADLELGRSGVVDHAAAARAYRKAALLGFPLAQNRLGWLYESGQGVPQDYVTAYMWYTIAASHGDHNATQNRDALSRRLTPGAILEAQALAREVRQQMP